MSLQNRRVLPWRITVLVTLVTAGPMMAVSGCALFEPGGKLYVRAQKIFNNEHETAGQPGRSQWLPRIAAPRNSIQLEIIFVERPIDDPLLGSALWDKIDQAGALDSDVRESLSENGFRVGQAGSHPPRALETLLGLQSEIPDDAESPDSKHLIGHRVALRSGAATEIQTSRFRSKSSLRIPGTNGIRIKDFLNSRCVLRLKAKRLQNGWAQLEFLPEIHHGPQTWRPTATKAGWQGQTTQRINKLYDLRFSVTLNLGEFVVITSNSFPADDSDNGSDATSLGPHFFLSGPKDQKLQRVLIVRLSNVNQSDGIYGKQ
jgi:hypothetical protein